MRLCVGIAAFHPEAAAWNGNGLPVAHQAIDHVDHSREANRDAALTSGVAKCREEMRFAHPGNAVFITRNFTGFDVSTPRCFCWVRKYLNSAQLVDACGV
jgi:hypothetical protein